MRSIVAPMIAISRAARSSMRSTAPASQVGLSHSTQLLSPCNMASESKGRLAGFMGVLSVFDGVFLAAVLYENEPRRNCKAKTSRGMISLPGKLRLACQGRVRVPAPHREIMGDPAYGTCSMRATPVSCSGAQSPGSDFWHAFGL